MIKADLQEITPLAAELAQLFKERGISAGDAATAMMIVIAAQIAQRADDKEDAEVGLALFEKSLRSTVRLMSRLRKGPDNPAAAW